MHKRCAYCGGPLGLISHRKRRLRFCRLSHKKAWEKREEELWQLKKQQFFDFLARGSPAR
jgi:hypothetical protein